MTTHAIPHTRTPDTRSVSRAGSNAFLAPLGRTLYSGIFLLSTPGHFKKETIGYAASHGVPLANLVVPASGILALVGALMVWLGFKARIGAWLLVFFLIPVTVMMHDFWNVADPMMARMQEAMFLKNLSMLGGAFLIAYFGAGPISLDTRRNAP